MEGDEVLGMGQTQGPALSLRSLHAAAEKGEACLLRIRRGAQVMDLRVPAAE